MIYLPVILSKKKSFVLLSGLSNSHNSDNRVKRVKGVKKYF